MHYQKDIYGVTIEKEEGNVDIRKIRIKYIEKG